MLSYANFEETGLMVFDPFYVPPGDLISSVDYGRTDTNLVSFDSLTNKVAQNRELFLRSHFYLSEKKIISEKFPNPI